MKKNAKINAEIFRAMTSVDGWRRAQMANGNHGFQYVVVNSVRGTVFRLPRANGWHWASDDGRNTAIAGEPAMSLSAAKKACRNHYEMRTR